MRDAANSSGMLSDTLAGYAGEGGAISFVANMVHCAEMATTLVIPILPSVTEWWKYRQSSQPPSITRAYNYL